MHAIETAATLKLAKSKLRSGQIPEAEPADYNLSTTLPSSAYVVTDGSGQVLRGSVTIPAGSGYADIIVYPIEDYTPRDTKRDVSDFP